MRTAKKYSAPTWNEVHEMMLRIAEKIRDDAFRPDIIVGLARGGLVPARVFSDLLEQSNLATIRTECYVGTSKSKSKPVLSEKLSARVEGQSVLLVDDVADTGRSLKLAKRHIMESGAREIRIVALFKKPWSTLKPDYSAAETSLWVVFPWDMKETVRSAFENRGNMTNTELSEKLKSAGLPEPLVDRFLREISGEKTC